MIRSLVARLVACWLSGLVLLASPTFAAEDGDALFTERVRPLLEARCFECHGPHAKRLRGGLMMSSHEALVQGGGSGPALVPGDPSTSLLMELVTEEDADYRMPPKEALSPGEIALLEEWIALGAPWPGGEAVLRDVRDIDLEEGRQWWSFRPVEDPPPPGLASDALEARATGDLDRFVFARLEGAGLNPAPPAHDAQLVRRLYFDLLGLPPTPEEIERYLRDRRSDRWERLIDELLARPEYGERQARAWLDVVRFAQTNGYERDEEKPMAWRYRDYVIESFNADKPFDVFLREQLAGDEAPEPSPAQLIATGFYRVGAWDSEPDDRVQADLDQSDDILRTISEGMLGLTIGCARCHDHRTDPIRQQDYYSLLSFVQNLAPYRRPKFSLEDPLLQALDATPRNLQRHERLRVTSQTEARGLVDEYVADLLDRYERPEARPVEASARVRHVSRKEFQEHLSADERLQLYLFKSEAAELADSFQGELTWALVASERGREPAPTHVLRRGRADAPLEEVAPSFPPVLCPTDQDALPEQLEAREHSSGRRTALARWITDPGHPLTARVFVNRIWQGHFGAGIVRTPDDFGVTGDRPSHPELLDWLASRFVASGWSVKDLHRLILTSAAYRMASSADSPEAAELDPTNRLLWRQNLRRLDAESLRDACLAVAGTLNRERGGRGFFPSLSREALAGSSKPGFGWENDSVEARSRRAIYTFAKRSQLDPLQEVFDLANPTLPQGHRPETTVASQSLALLNSEFSARCAQDLVRRVERERPSGELAQLERMFALGLGRAPRPRELEVAQDFLASQRRAFERVEPLYTFKARKPDRLEVDYLAALAPTDFLVGPHEGWSFFRGEWGLRYNQTVQYDRESGPGALLERVVLADGEVSARLRISAGAPLAGLLVRARERGDAFVGLQVLLDPEAGLVELLQHVAPGAEPIRLAEARVELEPERELALRVQLAGETVRVWIDGVLTLETREATHVAPGLVGVRTWGDGCELRDLHVGGALIEPVPPPPAAERALASFALLLFNLNEFLYID